MPPTDEHFAQEEDSVDVEHRGSMESRALRHQLDRLRTLQQKNEILSGDRNTAPKRGQKGAKPSSLRNYYKWLRDGSPEASTPRPRSRSLQLDASDLSSVLQKSESRGTCSPPGTSSKRLVPKLPLGGESDGDIATVSPSQTPKCGSPTQSHRQQKHQNKTKSSPPQTPRKRTTNSVSTPKSNNSKVKLERGTVIKPKVGGQSKRVLSPIKRQRSKSLDTDGAKFVAASQTSSPVSRCETPILPDITPMADRSSCSSSASSSESLSSTQSKKPVSILKKCGSSETFPKGAKTAYSVHVTFDETPFRIPSGYQRGRRASIAEESSFLRADQTPPPCPPSPGGNMCHSMAWMAPGILPRRRNSLPPLSVPLSEILAMTGDDDDDELYNTSRHSEDNSKTDESQTEFCRMESFNSDSSREDSETYGCSPPRTSSCFNVPAKTSPTFDEVDSDDGVKCDVVHSFTPRPRLKQNALSANTGLYIGS